MSATTILRGAGIYLAMSAALALAEPPPAKMLSHPVPLAIARTSLLMDAINLPGFRWLDHTLRTRPTDDRTWRQIRDHAQLIAENGNLLLLRPPKGKRAGTWLDRATALRLQAVDLSDAADKHHYADTRKALVALAGACTRCHKEFHVAVEVTAFGVQPVRPTNVTIGVTPPPLPPPVPQPPEPPSPPPVPRPPLR